MMIFICQNPQDITAQRVNLYAHLKKSYQELEYMDGTQNDETTIL